MPSTAIRTLSYDDETATLFVTFIDGDTYAYFDVPPAVHQQFRNARSKGGFFARRVRSRYGYRKLSDDDLDANPSPSSSGRVKRDPGDPSGLSHPATSLGSPGQAG